MLQTFGDPFIGCMKQIQVHGQSSESPITTNTRTCSDDLEPGNYFYDKGGYIRLRMLSHNFYSVFLPLVVHISTLADLNSFLDRKKYIGKLHHDVNSVFQVRMH